FLSCILKDTLCETLCAKLLIVGWVRIFHANHFDRHIYSPSWLGW
ncbi:unnamed protein product, partial [Amoebophrya sp. A25]